jgi:DMSO reductase anchor subunit
MGICGLTIQKPGLADWTRAVVELLAIAVGGWAFFTTEEPVPATLFLGAGVLAGELIGRAAENWVKRRQSRRPQR